MRNKKGFTLIELMVVVLIIGILTAIVVPNYEVSILKTKVVNNMVLMRSLQNDIVNFYDLNNALPTKLTQLAVNAGEFTNWDGEKTQATHVSSGCSMALDDDKRGVTMSCAGWQMSYRVKSTNFGYSVGNKIFKITTQNDSEVNRLQKVANNFGWPEGQEDNTYIIQ
ncbi:MAG: prepilin-type N-terminal cleavage/methylation domain-containing protein [Elusimicrobiaceae bacterium]|nr:prepilin-type N-terminal cleavage/methylation domain-containing protein [Elusimicrobiaceae bacterium]